MVTRRKLLNLLSALNVSDLLSHHANAINRISKTPKTLRVYYGTQSSKLPEYEMPSVTWGVIQGRKEKLVSRVIIFDYLKGLGIIPDELHDLELPSTVDVMHERVEFLQKIGLTVDDINNYPLILGCSVRKNMIPVLGYLEKIGIGRPKLGEFVKNYPQVLHASVIVELAPVVKFLRGLDVEKDDIGYVLQKYPELLGFKLEGTMSTSVAYLVSIGVNPRDIGPMVTQYPYFLGMRVGTMIKPLIDYLVDLGLPKKVLARMLEKRAYILGYDLEETVKPNVECLISFGVRRECLASVIAQYPQILGLPLKAKLSTQQYFFSLKLKVDPEGFARVVENMPQVVSLNQHVIMKPVEFLLGRTVTVEDVARMVIKCPQLVALRVELMKNSYYFFKSEMGRPLKELVEFPEYFTYSLESRIKLRYQRLKSKGIRCSLNWMLNCSDQRFEERLQGHYIETESASPRFCMGGKLELPGNDIMSDDEAESDDELLEPGRYPWLFKALYGLLMLLPQQSAAFKILKTRLKAVPSYSFNGEQLKKTSSGNPYNFLHNMSGGSQINEDGEVALDRGNSLNGINFAARLQQFQQMQHQHRVHLKTQTLKNSSSSSKEAQRHEEPKQPQLSEVNAVAPSRSSKRAQGS